MDQRLSGDLRGLADLDGDDLDAWPSDEAVIAITQLALSDVLADVADLVARQRVARPTLPVIQLALALIQGNDQAARTALAAVHAALRVSTDPTAAPRVPAA